MDKKVEEAVNKIREYTRLGVRLGLIVGSGLGSLTEEFSNVERIKYEEIPNLRVSSVKGHRGEVVIGRFSGVDMLAFSGRLHYYEGFTMQEVSFPVKIMAGLGIKTMIITNASGAVNRDFSPGDIAVISDHINLTGDNPLRGTNCFIDMTEAYDRRLRNLAKQCASKLGLEIREGIYLVLNGPSYESPAEIRMARNMGADIVGMSTIPEVIMANSLGMNVLGLSVVTNMAAGITGDPLSHEEVIERALGASERLKNLLREIVKNIGDELR